MPNRKIAIGSDHAAFEFKQALLTWLQDNGFEAEDCGSFSPDTPIDYPDVAELVCQKVSSGGCEKGVLVCGTGIGMNIAANKHSGIRAAVCSDYYSAKYTRLHNDANVACFGARVMGVELAKEMLSVFLSTSFEGGRHQARVDKLNQLDKR